MAITYSFNSVAATTSEQTVFTATAAQAVISTVAVCNTSSSNTLNINLFVKTASSVAGSTSNAFVYGAPIPPNTTVTWTLGIGLAPNNVISASASAAGITVTAFGSTAS